jgi:CheY-like chemotaxis protein
MMDGGSGTPERAPLVRVIDPDRAAQELLQEWLRRAGYRVDDGTDGAAAVLIVDVPFTRRGAPEQLRELARRHPGTPILALSPTLFSHVRCDGDCARALGVAAVLPKPVSREQLIAAVRDVLERGR